MVTLNSPNITSVKIIDAISHQKLVNWKDQTILAKIVVGASFGPKIHRLSCFGSVLMLIFARY